jgi:hypothetical protein
METKIKEKKSTKNSKLENIMNHDTKVEKEEIDQTSIEIKNDIENSNDEQSNDEHSNNEHSNNQHSNEEIYFNYNKDDWFNKLDMIYDSFTGIVNKSKNITNFPIDKNFIEETKKKIKKIKKVMNNLDDNFLEFLQKGFKPEKEKKPKKQTNKENHPIRKKKDIYPEILQILDPEVLQSLNLSSETQLSRADIMQIINKYVNNEKNKENKDIIVENDKKSFNIIGKLVPLFDFIHKIKIERKDCDPNDLPVKQLRYDQIMGISKYFNPLN